MLKDKRVDLSADNNYAIKWASFYGRKEVVEPLLKDERVDPSVNENEAIRKSKKEIKTILINWAQNNPNQRGSAEIINYISK